MIYNFSSHACSKCINLIKCSKHPSLRMLCSKYKKAFEADNNKYEYESHIQFYKNEKKKVYILGGR